MERTLESNLNKEVESHRRGRAVVAPTSMAVVCLIVIALSMSSCGFFQDPERELIERVDIELPTAEEELEKKIRVPIEDFGLVRFVVEYEIRNPSTMSVDVSFNIGFEPESSSGPFVTEYQLEEGDVATGDVNRAHGAHPHTLFIELEASGPLGGHFDIYAEEILD